MPSATLDYACGTAFGSALYAAGVFAPNVIIEQLQWTNMHMLRTFIVASGASALVFKIARSTGHAPLPIRVSRNLGHFPFDGNVLGGALVGAGMAVTGACPGTSLVQLSALLPVSRNVLAGGLLGGLILPSLWPLLNRSGSKKTTQSVLKVEVGGPWATLAAWEGICALVIYATYLVQPEIRAGASLVSPVLGGLLIGAAQALSMLVRKAPLGVSAAYGDLGRYVRSLAGCSGDERKKTGSIQTALTPSVVFALGIISGAWLMTQCWSVPANTALWSARRDMSFGTAFMGGCAMTLGAGIAGGCTSGHGISGMSAFSVASMVSTASMFAAGTAVALIMQ